MSYTVALDLPADFCVTPRNVSLTWGYCKILINLLMLLLSGVLMFELSMKLIFDFTSFHNYFAIGLVVYTVMTSSVIADIVLHVMLVIGVHEDKVDLLKAFCKYTKTMWTLTPLLVCLYTILTLTKIPMNFDLERFHLQSRLNIFTFTMSFAIVFQTLVMLAVIKEIKNIEEDNDGIISGSTKIFNTKIKLEIETVSTEEVIEKNVTEVNTKSDVLSPQWTLPMMGERRSQDYPSTHYTRVKQTSCDEKKLPI